MKLTLKAIGDHLGVSHNSASDICERLGIDRESVTLDQVRLAYCADLRDKAAGRGVDSITELKKRKLELECADRQLGLDLKRGNLVEVDIVKFGWQDLTLKMRGRLLALPTRIAVTCHGLDQPGIEREARRIVHEALHEIARGGDTGMKASDE